MFRILCLCFSFLKARLWRDQDSGSADDACFLGLVKVWQLSPPSVLCGCMFLFVRSFACDSVHHLLSENIF